MTCAKKIVRCTIITRSGIAYTGENRCDSPQIVCPRTKGEDYTKCKTICRQEAHAEIIAMKQCYPEELIDAIAIITGIDYVCKECARALSTAGVKEFIVRP